MCLDQRFIRGNTKNTLQLLCGRAVGNSKSLSIAATNQKPSDLIYGHTKQNLCFNGDACDIQDVPEWDQAWGELYVHFCHIVSNLYLHLLDVWMRYFPSAAFLFVSWWHMKCMRAKFLSESATILATLKNSLIPQEGKLAQWSRNYHINMQRRINDLAHYTNAAAIWRGVAPILQR